MVLVNAGMRRCPTKRLTAAVSVGGVLTGTWQPDVIKESGSVLAEVAPRSEATRAMNETWRAAETWWRSRWLTGPDKMSHGMQLDFGGEFQDAVDAIMVHWHGW